MRKSSRLPGFYKLSPEERLEKVKKFARLSDEEAEMTLSGKSLTLEQANRMIENVIGIMSLPIGIATNFRINGKDYLIPMVIEEPSVVAAASHGARMARSKGGFITATTEPIMIAQVQVVNMKDLNKAKKAILAAKGEILKKANETNPTLINLGGGARDLRVRILKAMEEPMLIVELLVDCRDAMGANTVNTMAEAVAPLIERLTDGDVSLRIVSNLATERLARAEVVIDKKELGGEEVVDAIVRAYAFAEADPYRATTHNKGIMNGIVAVLLATGNDTRAVEAGAHAYASLSGRYRPLTKWWKNEDGDLAGSIELPMAVGIVGGATMSPAAKVALKILGVKTASELAGVLAAVGLAQNLAALKALVTEGIQRGHMRLHAKRLAMMAGAVGDQIDIVARRMVEEGKISFGRAKEIVEEVRK